jgi:hypothetical protein
MSGDIVSMPPRLVRSSQQRALEKDGGASSLRPFANGWVAYDQFLPEFLEKLNRISVLENRRRAMETRNYLEDSSQQHRTTVERIEALKPQSSPATFAEVSRTPDQDELVQELVAEVNDMADRRHWQEMVAEINRTRDSQHRDEMAVPESPRASTLELNWSADRYQPREGKVMLSQRGQAVLPAGDMVRSGQMAFWSLPNNSFDRWEIGRTRRGYGLASFFQLVAASVLGVVLYIGISGWVYIGQYSPAWNRVPATIGRTIAPTVDIRAGAAFQELNKQAVSLLPGPYRVYAGNNGKFSELEQLPIKIEDPNGVVSANISPSRVTLDGHNLSFVVFGREGRISAPQTATVRGIIRMPGSANAGTWQFQPTTYSLKMPAAEGSQDMIAIRPDAEFAFPPGRYALVLDGLPYDFTVAGSNASAGPCMVEVLRTLSGSVYAKCKS